MGNCCAPGSNPDPAKKYDANTPPAQNKRPSSNSKLSKKSPALPDFGLSSTHECLQILGRGGEGETYLFRDKATNEQVAIKLVKRPIPKAALGVIKREVHIQANVGEGHLNIVRLEEVILTHSFLGLVLEYVAGGNMVQYVTKKRASRADKEGLCMGEDEARYYFRQLIAAVEFCHKNQVAHRDLKLDNTLLDTSNPSYIKLCDFGFAKHWGGDTSNMNTMRIGTPEYMGPELINSRTGYDGKKVDVWAAGVLLYVMLVGLFPFENQDNENFGNTAGLYEIWLQQIKTSWREMPGNSGPAQKLSAELKDLLDKMFDVRQETRISLEGIKQHPWFTKPLPPHYQAALDTLNTQQAELEKATENIAKPNLAERDKQLEAILDRAAHASLPTEDMVRIPLTRLKKADGAIVPRIGGMAAVQEE